jgi:hypothetical protein
MKKRLIIIVIISCLMSGPVPAAGLDILDKREKIELINTWQIFLQAVSIGDLNKIRNISVEKIRCLSCVDNTGEEDKEIENLQKTNLDWYKKLYEEKVYIPINKFCEQDFPIIFTAEYIRKMQNSEPTYAVEDFNDRKIYEVIIPGVKSGELPTAHEGVLHIFQFVKTDHGYKFWGIDTIP